MVNVPGLIVGLGCWFSAVASGAAPNSANSADFFH